MINANENCYASHYAGPLSFELVWFPQVAVNAGVQQANNSCRRPAARGHPPGGGEERGDDLLGEQRHVPLHLQQVQHQRHESAHHEEDHAPLHQVPAPVQGAARTAAGAPRPASHRRLRGASGAQHLIRLGGRVARLRFVPPPGSARTAPGAALQPGHRPRRQPSGPRRPASAREGRDEDTDRPPPPSRSRRSGL